VKLTIVIHMDNAAFADEPGYEAARILRGYADNIEANGEPLEANLLDSNGNTVCHVKLDR
jgi:hypothetical protein